MASSVTGPEEFQRLTVLGVTEAACICVQVQDAVPELAVIAVNFFDHLRHSLYQTELLGKERVDDERDEQEFMSWTCHPVVDSIWHSHATSLMESVEIGPDQVKSMSKRSEI